MTGTSGAVWPAEPAAVRRARARGLRPDGGSAVCKHALQRRSLLLPSFTAALAAGATRHHGRRAAHHLPLQHPYQGDADHPLQEGRQVRSAEAWRRSTGSCAIGARTKPPRWIRSWSICCGRSTASSARPSHPHHFRLSVARHQRDAAQDGRRAGQPEPPHPRQGRRRAFPRRPRQEPALLGADPRARRRRLLPDLGHPVRAHRYRSRARLAAPAAQRAGAAVPQRPHPASARGWRADQHGRREVARGPPTRSSPCRSPQFHDLRAQPRLPVQTASLDTVAAATAGAAAAGRAAATLGTRPSDRERARLAESGAPTAAALLAAPKPVSRKAPRGQTTPGQAIAGRGADPARTARPCSACGQPRRSSRTQLVPAPDYDDEHPEELSYRPFPIAPFLTATASADDPALSRMVHPDLAKITRDASTRTTSPRRCGCVPGLHDGRAHVGAAVQGRGRRPSTCSTPTQRARAPCPTARSPRSRSSRLG